MKAFLCVIALLNISSYAYCQNTLSLENDAVSPKTKIEEVSWIAGHWKGEALGGIIEEIWSPSIGNSMMGSFRLVKFNKVSFYEIETITEVNESLVLKLKHFHGDLKGWEEKDETVDFPLVKIEDNKAFFDGMTFERISKSEMHIYVLVGSVDANMKEMKFEYKLVQ